MGAHGECTREVVGAAPGTRLSWLGGRVGCSRGRVRGREGVGLLGLVSGRKLQGRVSRYSSSSVAPGGCILSISYVISVSMQCFVLDVIIKVGSCKVLAVLDWRSVLAHSQLWLFGSLSENR